MKKRIMGILLIAVVGAMLFPVGVFAADSGEIPGETVYGTKGEQDAVYKAAQESKELARFLAENGISIIRESITPVYGASLLEYAETGVFAIRLFQGGKSGEAYTCIGKTITADGLFAGNILIRVENGTVRLNGFTPTPVLEHFFHPNMGFGSNEFLVSHSYADHARRIQKATNRESFVPISEVRYVSVEGLGQVFYINDGNTEALVNIESAGNLFYKDNREIVYIGDEVLKKFADERLADYEALLAQIAAWEAANPGKKSSFNAGGGVTPFAVRDSVDNIINIVEYLGLKDSDVYYTSIADATANPTSESAAKEGVAAENPTAESGTADNRETDSMESDGTTEESITTESTAENTATANTGAANTATAGAMVTDTPPSLAWLWLLAIPFVAVAVFMGIRLTRRRKKPEPPDGNSNDN